MQEHEAALRYFQRAAQLDPGFAYAYTLSGHEYFACEDFEQARKLYETALSVDRRHYNAWCAHSLRVVPSQSVILIQQERVYTGRFWDQNEHLGRD